DIDVELVNINQLRGGRAAAFNISEFATAVPQPTAMSADPAEHLSLEDYFQRFVLQHQVSMSETELARKLGVSRKCLWERRQRFGIQRKKVANKSASASS